MLQTTKIRPFLAATRFNEETKIQNIRYKHNKHFTGSLYPVPVKISPTITENAPIYVFEMDLSLNSKSITGIGFIINNLQRKISCNVYSVPKYNKYLYFSKYRIDISDLTNEQLLFIHKIQYVLFKTKRHIQRSIGITRVPIKNLQLIDSFQNKSTEFILNAIDEFIYNLFKTHFPEF